MEEKNKKRVNEKQIKSDKKGKTKQTEKTLKEDNIKPIKEYKFFDSFNSYIFYTIIFSILGLILEIIFQYATSGIFQVEQISTLGPMCIIYGISIAILIGLLKKHKGHKLELFIYGIIIATVIQYIFSFIIEGTLKIRLWDYSSKKFNINGRICLMYSVFWGIFTVIIINGLKSIIDKLVNKIKGKARTAIDIILFITLLVYTLFTVWGLAVYSVRAKETLNGKNYITNNTVIQKFQNEFFTTERMEKLFPNIKILDNDKDWIYVKDIFEK